MKQSKDSNKTGNKVATIRFGETDGTMPTLIIAFAIGLVLLFCIGLALFHNTGTTKDNFSITVMVVTNISDTGAAISWGN